MNYFQRTGKLGKKIDVYGRIPGKWVYLHSTNQHRTCREAKKAAAKITGYNATDLLARFDKREGN